MAKGRFRSAKLEGRDPEIVRTELAVLEDEWLASRLRGETELSANLLDENYQGITTSGGLQAKADFLQAIPASATNVTEAGHGERNIRVFGEVAVSTGVATLKSSGREHAFRYLRVFRHHAGEWRLVASQATRSRVG